MAVRLLLDNNVIIYLLAGKLAEPLPRAYYFVSVITENELLSYPSLSQAERQHIQAFLDQVMLIELSRQISTRAIRVRRESPFVVLTSTRAGSAGYGVATVNYKYPFAMSAVQVAVRSFADLFDKAELPLKIDTYQRGFVWAKDKVRQLLEDLHHHERHESAQSAYYMGTVLLHKNVGDAGSEATSGLFIIDGQQRLTALAILRHQLLGEKPPNFALRYNEVSCRRIREATAIIRACAAQPSADVFQNIRFTVIRVDRADLAFTFFDTQNNRGVPLHATDLLKAFHLRAINGADREVLQRQCAGRWERIQQSRAVLAPQNEFTHSLFRTFLWRARRWTGKRANFGDHDALLNEFQHHALRNDDGDANIIPLYHSRHNRLADHLTLSAEGRITMTCGSIVLREDASALPFAIRQPVQEGLGFFLYADKYAALLQWLMPEKPASPQRDAFRAVYNDLLKANSLYLREIFLVCALVYADQFGEDRLLEFGLWLEHAMGHIRMTKAHVRYQRAQKFFYEPELNLLDLIANAFTPQQVIGHLRQRAEAFDTGLIQSDINEKGVQGDYRSAVLKYFDKHKGADLADRKNWIEPKLGALNGSLYQ